MNPKIEATLASREKDITDIKEVAELAELATQKLQEAERMARAEGSVYSLARFGYQVSKSGLPVEKIFSEIKGRVERKEQIPKQMEGEEKRSLEWALSDIASWQHLSGRPTDAEHTLKTIQDPITRASTYTRLARKLRERKGDGDSYLRLAEVEVDSIPDPKEKTREGKYLARNWAEAGDREQVERLIKKYNPNQIEQEEDLVDLARNLADQGVNVEDVFINAFKNETHPVDEFFRRDLISGLIQTGHVNEALVLVLEQPEGDTPELDEAWIKLSKALANEDSEAAMSAWKEIASLAKLDPKAVATAGITLAQIGDEPNAEAVITLLDKLEEQTSEDSGWEKGQIQKSKHLIRLNLALQFIEKKRSEAEKRTLVNERFHKPLAEAVKDLLVQIPDLEVRVDGLRQLARRMAERGNNPNMFGIVDQIELAFKSPKSDFDESTVIETFLELAELTAKGLGSKDGTMKIPQQYIDKTIAYLKSKNMYPLPPTDYYSERLWVAETRVAVAAIQAARERLSRGTKTKAKTSAHLNKLPVSAQARKLIESIRPA